MRPFLPVSVLSWKVAKLYCDDRLVWAELNEGFLSLVSILGGAGIIISSPLRPLSRSERKNLTSVIFPTQSQDWPEFYCFYSELQT